MRLFSHTLFALLSAAALALCLFVTVQSAGLVGGAFSGFALSDDNIVDVVSLNVWGAQKAGLRSGDRVVAVNGDRAFSVHFLKELIQASPPGKKMVYLVEGLSGDERFISLPTRRFDVADILKSHVILAPIGLLFVLIAGFFYIVRPATVSAWSFFGLFAGIGTSMCAVVDDTMIWKLPKIYPYLGPFIPLLSLILIGVIAGTFRKSSSLRPWVWALIVIEAVVSSAIAIGHYFTLNNARAYDVFDTLMFAWHGFASVSGLLILALAFRRELSAQRRARIRQILWAWPVGAGIPTLSLLFGQLRGTVAFSPLWYVFMLLIPLSTADAIIRHDLLKLNHSARRFVGGMTVASLMGIGLGAAMWASSNFLLLRDAAGMIALAAILFAIGAPITHRVQRVVDRILHAEPYDSSALLAEFTGRISTTQLLPDVREKLKTTLGLSVKPNQFSLYRYESDQESLLSLDDGHRVPLEEKSDFAALLDASEAIAFDEDLPRPQGFDDAEVAVPLFVAGELVGVLSLGARESRRPYEGADLAFVSSLAGPLAAALINTRAYEEIQSLNRVLEERVAQRTKALSEKNGELAQLNQRKDELVATVSHDFRSPLAIIRQNVQTTLRDFGRIDDEDLRDFLEGIARQESRLSSMCENLLDLAKLKQVGTPTDPVDLRALCQSFISEYSPRAAAKGLALNFVDEGPSLAQTLGDEARLGQVLQNLVDNAIKFTNEGCVTLRLSQHSQSVLALEVEDEGIGMSSADVDRVFEPFYQVPLAGRAGQGSGLGLAIVREVARSHGGEAFAKSVLNQGTVFSVHLLNAASSKDDRPTHASSPEDHATPTPESNDV